MDPHKEKQKQNPRNGGEIFGNEKKQEETESE
jgi:hypothetical protein